MSPHERAHAAGEDGEAFGCLPLALVSSSRSASGAAAAGAPPRRCRPSSPSISLWRCMRAFARGGPSWRWRPSSSRWGRGVGGASAAGCGRWRLPSRSSRSRGSWSSSIRRRCLGRRRGAGGNDGYHVGLLTKHHNLLPVRNNLKNIIFWSF